jgi:hypothetical protein
MADESGGSTDVKTLERLVMQMFADRDKLADERLAQQRDALKVAIDAQDKLTQAALNAADRAVVKAETATEKRFEAVNEFRQTLSDQASLYVTRKEIEQAIKTITDKVEHNTAAIATMMSREEVDARLSAQSMQTQILKQGNADKIADLTAHVNRTEGKGSGMDKMWAIVVGIIGLIGILFSIYNNTIRR